MIKTISHKGYLGSVEYSQEDGVFFGKVLGIFALVSYEGETEEKLFEDFKSAVEDYISYLQERKESEKG